MLKKKNFLTVLVNISFLMPNNMYSTMQLHCSGEEFYLAAERTQKAQ